MGEYPTREHVLRGSAQSLAKDLHLERTFKLKALPMMFARGGLAPKLTIISEAPKPDSPSYQDYLKRSAELKIHTEAAGVHLSEPDLTHFAYYSLIWIDQLSNLPHFEEVDVWVVSSGKVIIAGDKTSILDASPQNKGEVNKAIKEAFANPHSVERDGRTERFI